MSELHQSLSHSKWDCKYHVVFNPQVATEGPVREDPSPTRGDFSCLGPAEGIQIIEGHLKLDHVPMCMAIPRSTRWPRSSGS